MRQTVEIRAMIRATLLLVAAAVAVLAVTYWPQPIQAPTTSSPAPITSGVTVEWQMPNGPAAVVVDCPAEACEETAFTALQKAAAQANISLQYQTYDGLGVLVTDIAGLVNGKDGKYWVYEVNGQKIPVAADAQRLLPGDKLTWKFVIPE